MSETRPLRLWEGQLCHVKIFPPTQGSMDDIEPVAQVQTGQRITGHVITLRPFGRDGFRAPLSKVVYPASIDVRNCTFSFTADCYAVPPSNGQVAPSDVPPVTRKLDFFHNRLLDGLFVPSWSLLLAEGRAALSPKQSAWVAAYPLRFFLCAFIDASTHTLRIPAELFCLFEMMRYPPQDVSKCLQSLIVNLNLPFPFKSYFDRQLRLHGSARHFKNLLAYEPCVSVSAKARWKVFNVEDTSSTFQYLYGDVRVPVEILESDDADADASAGASELDPRLWRPEHGVLTLAAAVALGPAGAGRPPAALLSSPSAPGDTTASPTGGAGGESGGDVKTEGDSEMAPKSARPPRRVAALRYVVTAERGGRSGEVDDYHGIDVMPDFFNEAPRIRSVGYGAAHSPYAAWRGALIDGKHIFDAMLQRQGSAHTPGSGLPPTWAMARAASGPGAAGETGVKVAISAESSREAMFTWKMPNEARQSKCTVSKSLIAMTGAKFVLDAASAYGDRALAALSLPGVVRYVGVDCNPDLFGPYAAHPRALLDLGNGFGNMSDLGLTDAEAADAGVTTVAPEEVARVGGFSTDAAAATAARWATQALPPASDLSPLQEWEGYDGLRNETGGYRRLLKTVLPATHPMVRKHMQQQVEGKAADGSGGAVAVKKEGGEGAGEGEGEDGMEAGDGGAVDAKVALRSAARCAWSCDMFQCAYIPPHPPILGVDEKHEAPAGWTDPHQPAPPAPHLVGRREALFDLALVSPAPYRTETYSTGTGQASNVATFEDWFASYIMMTMLRCYHRVRVGGFVAVTFLDRVSRGATTLKALELLLLSTEALCPGAIYNGAVGWHGSKEQVPYFLFMRSDPSLWKDAAAGTSALSTTGADSGAIGAGDGCNAAAGANAKVVSGAGGAACVYTDVRTRLRLRRGMVLRILRRVYPSAWTRLLLHAVRAHWPVPPADAADAIVRAAGTPRVLRCGDGVAPVDLRLMPALDVVRRRLLQKDGDGGPRGRGVAPSAKRRTQADGGAGGEGEDDVFSALEMPHGGVEAYAEMFEVAAEVSGCTAGGASSLAGVAGLSEVYGVYDAGPFVPGQVGMSDPLNLLAAVGGTSSSGGARGTATASEEKAGGSGGSVLTATLPDLVSVVNPAASQHIERRGEVAGVGAGELGTLPSTTVTAFRDICSRAMAQSCEMLKGVVSDDARRLFTGEWEDANSGGDADEDAGVPRKRGRAVESANALPPSRVEGGADSAEELDRWFDPRGGELRLLPRTALGGDGVCGTEGGEKGGDVYSRCGDAGLYLCAPAASAVPKSVTAAATLSGEEADAAACATPSPAVEPLPKGAACTRTPFEGEKDGAMKPHATSCIPTASYTVNEATSVDPTEVASVWWTAHIPLPAGTTRASAIVVPEVAELEKRFTIDWWARRQAEARSMVELRGDGAGEDAEAMEAASDAAQGWTEASRWKVKKAPEPSDRAVALATRAVVGPGRVMVSVHNAELHVLRVLMLHLRRVVPFSYGPYRATGVVPLKPFGGGHGGGGNDGRSALYRPLVELFVPARVLRRLVMSADSLYVARAISLAIILLQLPYPLKSSFISTANRPPLQMLEYAKTFAESVWKRRCMFDPAHLTAEVDGLLVEERCDLELTLPTTMPHSIVVAAATAQERTLPSTGDVAGVGAGNGGGNDNGYGELLEAAVTQRTGLLRITTDDSDYDTIDVMTDVWTEGDRLLSRKVVSDINVRPAPVSVWVHPAYHSGFLLDAVESAFMKKEPLDSKGLREAIYGQFEFRDYECTQFKITTAVTVMRLLCPAKISSARWLDISSGWGDRLAAAATLCVAQYVGVDPNPAMAARYIDLVSSLDPTSSVAVLSAEGKALLPPSEAVRVKSSSIPALANLPPGFVGDTVAVAEADPTSPWKPGVEVRDSTDARYTFVQSGFEQSGGALERIVKSEGLFDVVYSSPPFFDYELYGSHREGQSISDALLVDESSITAQFKDEVRASMDKVAIEQMIRDSAGEDDDNAQVEDLILAVALARKDARRVALAQWVVSFFFKAAVLAADSLKVGGVFAMYIVDTTQPPKGEPLQLDPRKWGYGFTEPGLALICAFEPRLRYRGCLCAKGKSLPGGKQQRLRPTWVFERVEPLPALAPIVDVVAAAHKQPERAVEIAKMSTLEAFMPAHDANILRLGSEAERDNAVDAMSGEERSAWRTALSQRFLLGKPRYERVAALFEEIYPGLMAEAYPLPLQEMRKLLERTR